MRHRETALSEMLSASYMRFNEIVEDARVKGRPDSYSVGGKTHSPQQFLAMLKQMISSIEILFVNPLEKMGADASHVIPQLQGTIIALEKERQRNIT